MKLFLKVFVARILTSAPIGYLVKIFSAGILQKQDLKITVKSKQITPGVAASIYWGFYESAEIRFIHKYLRHDLPIIELGTSVGIIACISRKKNSEQLVCVEANPELIPVIEKNFELNEVKNYKIINAAIGYEKDKKSYFGKGNRNTSGKIINVRTKSSVLIKQITLSSILENEKINDFILICDIEGAEAFILQNDSNALQNCKQIIIETHQINVNDTLIKSSDIRDTIIGLGFTIKDKYGPNYVFEKN